jgi:hypothetical protein
MLPQVSEVVKEAGHSGCLASFMASRKSPIAAAESDFLNQFHIPSSVDTTVQIGNTATAGVRVWWEDDGTGTCTPEARGRLEMWGDVAHLPPDCE